MSTPTLFEVAGTALRVQYTNRGEPGSPDLRKQTAKMPRLYSGEPQAKWRIRGINQYGIQRMLKRLGRFEHAAQTQEVSLSMIA